MQFAVDVHPYPLTEKGRYLIQMALVLATYCHCFVGDRDPLVAGMKRRVTTRYKMVSTALLLRQLEKVGSEETVFRKRE